MFSHVEQALEHLNTALDSVEAAPSDLLRRTLGLSKQLRSRIELLEAKAAAVVAQREKHGDGGAGLVHQHSGLSRSDAARNVRTDTELVALPGARDAVAAGEISLANAARLAQAARKTSPDAVQGDPELIGLAKSLPTDEFARAAQRWTARHQDAADLAAQHRRNRRNRQVRFWNGDDGSVQMRGSFDAEMGARIQSRLRSQAEQLRRADRRHQAQPQQASGPAADRGNDGDAVVRTHDQRMADALDTLLANNNTDVNAKPDGTGDGRMAATKPETVDVGRKSTAAEIIVRADLAALTGQFGGVAEISGIGPIPPSALERLACNSDVWIEFFSDKLTPLYETVASRAPTAAQRRALVARDGVCIGCGAPPGDCEAHHINPWKCGGKTRVDNLVLVCWSCHDRIHDHNWQVVVRDGRFRLIPPDPAHPPNPAPSRKPKRRTPRQSVQSVQSDQSDQSAPAIAAQGQLSTVTPQLAQPAA